MGRACSIPLRAPLHSPLTVTPTVLPAGASTVASNDLAGACRGQGYFLISHSAISSCADRTVEHRHVRQAVAVAK
jgi:hypothetical protein